MSLRLQFPFRSPFKGDEASPMLSDGRALLVQSLADKHAQAAREGRLFIGSMAAGGAVLPIFSGTAQVCGLWNKAGSGVIASLVGIYFSYVDTTGAAGGYVLGINRDTVGGGLATGGISAFTEDTAVDNALSRKLGGNKVSFTASAATTIAPVIWRHLGLSQSAFTAAGTANMLKRTAVEFNGDAIIEPNSAVWLSGNIATSAKWAASIAWIEEPA